MYRLLAVEGVVLPRQQSAICTVDFLRRVFDGSMWCPHLSTSVHRPILNPPTIRDLQDMTIDALREHCSDEESDRVPAKLALLEVLENKVADRDFLLAVIATTDEQHPVLQKNYLPPRKLTRVAQALMVADPDGLLQTMQDLRPEQCAKRSSFQFLSKEDRLEKEIERCLAR
jgi:hypothetical protein